MIRFWISGTPVPKQSFRYSSRGGGYTAPAVKAWQTLVGYKAKEAVNGASPLERALSVTLTFHIPHKRRVDLDNLSKCILDACNEVVWVDDQQITLLTLQKLHHPSDPGVLVEVEDISYG